MELMIIGPAGCGKSSLVDAFSQYLIDNSYTVKTVNLDPATDPIYNADADLRLFVKTEHVMKTYSLGVNSALMKSIELGLRYVDNFKLQSDFVLYDTPGQMELFIYSESGRKFVETLSGRSTIGLFLMDATTIRDGQSFVSAVMQNVIVSLRLHMPTITVFSKSDVSVVDVTELKDQVTKERGALAELLEKVLFFIEYTTIPQRIIAVSNVQKSGFDELLSIVNEVFCSCGDLS